MTHSINHNLQPPGHDLHPKSSPDDAVSADSSRFPPWPPDWPEIAESISRAIARGDWGRYRGESTAELTLQICDFGSAKHCRLVSSGSIGVELALRGVGVMPGDQVVLCGYDYPGNFRAVELLGARPMLVDADPASFSIDPNELENVTHQDVVAVLVSHLYGVPAEIKSIREICDQRGWKLVEDACQTPGMQINGRPAGNWGDAAVFSFGGSKPLTAGNGGAILTNHDAIASKLNAYLDRPSDAIPISELQAAALIPQLARLNQCNQIRSETIRQIFQRVPWLVESIGDRQPVYLDSADRNSSDLATCYKLAFLCQDRDSVLARLSGRGLPVGPGYRSMHRSSDRRCGKLGDLGQCRALGKQVCLLDHAALLSTGDQRDRLVDSLGA